MPYTVKTKDGIIIPDIPDNLAPDSAEVKAMVMAERAKKQPQSGAQVTSDLSTPIPEQFGVGVPVQEPSLGQKAIGALESGAATVTGLTSGAAAQVMATPQAIADYITSGNFGSLEAAQNAERQVQQSAANMTYSPRTQLGQEYAGNIGNALATMGMGVGIPMAAELGAMGASRPNVSAATRENIVQGAKESITQPEQPIPVNEPVQTAMPNEAIQIAPEKELAGLTATAEKASKGSLVDKQKLIEQAKIDENAKKIGEEFGLDLPLDVYSDSFRFKELAASPRKELGTLEAEKWRQDIRATTDKFDDIFKELGAEYIDGIPSTAAVSVKVRESLKDTQKSLADESTGLYNQIDEAIAPDTLPEFNSVQNYLNTTLKELGGDEAQLKPAEKRLLAAATNGKTTYAGLRRIKADIGAALKGTQNEYYKDLDTTILKRLYGALSDDQLSHVEKVGGQELGQKLRAANDLTVKKKALEERIVDVFGNDVVGNLTPLLNKSMRGAKKQETTKFMELIDTVPEDLQKEVIATAIASFTRSTKGSEKGGFGLSEYTDFYNGIRANPEVYARVIKILGGEDKDKLLRSMFEISKRLTEGRANVMTNRLPAGVDSTLAAQSLIVKVLNSGAVEKGTGMTAMGVAGSMGGVPGAAAVGGIKLLKNHLTVTPKEKLAAIAELLRDEEFKKLAQESAKTGNVKKESIYKVIKSKAFSNYANRFGLPKDLKMREMWIISGLGYDKQDKESKK